MAVIEIDFSKKSNSKKNKTANQKKTSCSPYEPILLRQFRKLTELDQGRILGRIDAMLRDYE